MLPAPSSAVAAALNWKKLPPRPLRKNSSVPDAAQSFPQEQNSATTAVSDLTAKYVEMYD